MTSTLIRRAAATLSLTIALSTLAQIATATPIARKSPDGSIHITGLTDYASYQLAYKAIDPTRSVSVNACGVAKLTTNANFPLSATSNLSVSGGTAFQVSSLPIQATPNCRDGQLAGNTTPAAQLRDSNGSVYFTGLTPYAKVSVAYIDLEATRKVKANSCGALKIAPNVKFPMTGVIDIKTDTGSTVGSINTTTVPQADPPSCRNDVLSTPSTGWTGGSGLTGGSGS
jgi:hypothetical protein